MLKLWLKCTRCDATSNPLLTKAPHTTGGGYHIKARCLACGSHIKFISKATFTQSENDDLRLENGNTITGEQQHDFFK